MRHWNHAENGAPGSRDTIARLLELHDEAPATCAVCQARDVLDRTATRRWLTQRHLSRGQVLGALCCARHTWHIYELCGAGAQDQRAAMCKSLMQHALDGVLGQLHALAGRLERHGISGYLTRLHAHSLMPRTIPDCPLCATAAGHEQMARDLFNETLSPASPAVHRDLVQTLCPPHRGSAPTGDTEGQEAAAGWWRLPGRGEGSGSLVEQLLAGPDTLPTGICPLCWVRLVQERALMAALAVVSASDVSSDDAVAIHVYGEEWRIAVPAEWRADVLCSRHTALLHTDSVAPLPEQAHADGLSPTVWPAGTLRREPDRACPVCSVLSNWDRIRIAGLQRASGAALLLDDVAARLREALTARSTALCLRHWRAATTAPPEVAHTLINWQLRSVNTLYAAFLHRPDGDTAILPPARVRREGLPANADVAAHLFLAGYPA